MILFLKRQYMDECTIGEITNGVGRPIYTVERAWAKNVPFISCIPEGVYNVNKHTSPKFGLCFAISNVPDRQHILIHVANYARQLNGCIAVGLGHGDIDKDGVMDVVSSKNALDYMLSVLPDKFKLCVYSADDKGVL